MPDDLTRRAPEDRTKININQDWEVAWWCKELGVTEDRLRAAVAAVGPSVAKVSEYLRQH